MKTNREYNGMWGFLRYEMYQSWADYFVKFFDKYSEQGIQFWGWVTGNEPSLAMVPFTKINSVAWTPAMLVSLFTTSTTTSKTIIVNLGSR